MRDAIKKFVAAEKTALKAEIVQLRKDLACLLRSLSREIPLPRRLEVTIALAGVVLMALVAIGLIVHYGRAGIRAFGSYNDELVLAKSIVKRDFVLKDGLNLKIDLDSARWESARKLRVCSILKERCYLVSYSFNALEGTQVRPITAEWLVKFSDKRRGLVYVRASNTEARMLFGDTWLAKTLATITAPPLGCVVLRPEAFKKSRFDFSDLGGKRVEMSGQRVTNSDNVIAECD